MPLSRTLSKPLKVADIDSGEESFSEELAGELQSGSESDEDGSDADSIDDSQYDDEQEGEEEDEAEEGTQFQDKLSKVSFGALAKANAAMEQRNSSRKRKRGAESTAETEEKLQVLRERLQELKRAKERAKQHENTRNPSSRRRDDPESDSDNSDSDSSNQQPQRARSSKHAPTSMPSNRPVTRKRIIIENNAPAPRDPRFMSVGGPAPDAQVLSNKYSFLRDYRTSEMEELRTAIKKTKNEEQKEKLKRKLLSMESQAKAEQAKERDQKIIREHRKKEKEAIEQGKKPFYLKKCEFFFFFCPCYSLSFSSNARSIANISLFTAEQKKLALVDKFNSMKGKERERAIEKRRRKLSGREKKAMPAARRGGY